MMNYEEKILKYWHVPTSVIAFKKMLLENRNIKLENDLYLWDEEVFKIEDLTEKEQELLTSLIKRIDEGQKEFTLENLMILTKDVSKVHLNDKFVLMKYTQFVTYYDTWNAFYENCRGVVVNMESLKVSTATLKKFFNLNERIETSLGVVLNKLGKSKGNDVKYIKMDGSNVNVSYDDELLVTTPGAFENKQVFWSKSILEENHKSFIEDLKGENKDFTFIFELVGPLNRVVVYYEKMELVLLHVKNNTTGELLSYEETLNYANKYGFTPCPIVKEDLETLLETKDDKDLYKADEQEGWVIRIDLENEEPYFIKLKCGEYVNMHRLIDNSLNPKWILEAILSETFDDKVSAIENKQIKDIVEKIAERFYKWNDEKKEKLNQVYLSIPKEKWLPIEVINLKTEFENKVNELVKDKDNKDKIRSFLNQFSKGKTSDPDEEIRQKAKALFDMNLLNVERIEELDSYKLMLSLKTKKFINDLKTNSLDYILTGQVEDEYKEVVEEYLSAYKDIKNGVEDLDYWEEIFEKDNVEFYRLAGSKIENLKPNQVAISKYAKKKIKSEKAQAELVAVYKKKLNDFFFEGVKDEKLLTFFDEGLIINEDLKEYMLEKEKFENETVKEVFNDVQDQDLNKIVKEFYLIVRGLEVDNSYKDAKEVYEKIPDNLKDQKEFYKLKGMFSGYASKQIEKSYLPNVFDLFVLDKKDRLEYLKNKDFLPLASIITDVTKTKFDEFDINFTDIHELEKDLAIQDK